MVDGGSRLQPVSRAQCSKSPGRLARSPASCAVRAKAVSSFARSGTSASSAACSAQLPSRARASPVGLAPVRPLCFHGGVPDGAVGVLQAAGHPAGPARRGRSRDTRAARKLESLREYVLIGGEQCLVDVYRRDAEGEWTMLSPEGDEPLELNSVELAIPLAEIYRDVDFVSIP